MSRTSSARGARSRLRELLSWTPLLWGGLVLVLYVLLRAEDVRPVCWTLCQRAFDGLLPLLVLVGYLAPAARVARWSYGDADPARRLLPACACALALAMLTATVAGALGVLGPVPLAVTPALLTILFVREWGWLGATCSCLAPRARASLGTVSGALTASVLAAAFFLGLAPAVAQDALHYHLAVPKLWLAAGSFVDVPGNVYSRFPMAMDMLFATGLAFGSEAGAQLFHWLCLALSAAAVKRLADRFATPGASTWAPFLYVAIPSVFAVSGRAYVELAGVLYLLLAWDRHLDGRRLIGPERVRSSLLVALFLGVACGTKYPYLLPALILGIVEARRLPLRAIAGCLLAGFIGGGFWYARNIVDTGNPVYPFLYGIFGGSGWDAERAEIFETFLRQWGSGPFWLFPWTTTFDGTLYSMSRFDGIVGPVFLLAFPLIALLVWRRKELRSTAAFAGLLLLSWVATTHQVRFLIPALALIAALVPAAWEVVADSRRRQVAKALVLASAVVALCSHVIIFVDEAPLAYAAGLESGDDNRARRFPGQDYELFRSMDRMLPADAKVLFAGSGNPIYACPRPFHADSVVENHTLKRLLACGAGHAPGSEAEQGALEVAFQVEGFTHLLFCFDLVFGDSADGGDLSFVEKQRLAAFLAVRARLVSSAGDTLLYEVGSR